MAENRSIARILSVSEYLPDEFKIKVTERIVDFYFPPHGHEFYEIEFVTDGCAKYSVNNKEFTLEKGSLYFVTPADVHEVTVSEVPVSLINVQFDAKAVEPSLMLNLLKLSRECCVLKNEDFENALGLFNLVLSEYRNQGKYSNVCIKNYLENILVLFLRSYNGVEYQNKNEAGNLSTAVVYIHSKFREGVSLKEAADFCGFSPSYFSVKFLEHTGENFKEYVDKLKLSYAENLLKSTNLSITEICFSSGFKNVSSFIRRFNVKNGLSPAKYREIYSK